MLKYAITISLYHKELGTNSQRISKKLIEHTSNFNWSNINFPASYKEYIIFEKENKDIPLNVLYVPFNQKTICSKYISNRNHTTEKQITLLKITDNNEKWHFLALPNILTEDGCLKPIKAFQD